MVRVKHAALSLVGVTTIVFLLQQLFTGMTSALALQPTQFLAAPWTIVTAVFAHADYMHFFNNMFFLAFFGYVLEHYIGAKQFLVLFLAGGVLANMSAFIFYQGGSVLGASGAVSVVIASLAVLRPRNPGLFFGVPVPMWAALLGWIVLNTLGAMGTGGSTAFEAHLFGLGIGVVAGVYLRRRVHIVSPESEEEAVELPESVLRRWERKYME